MKKRRIKLIVPVLFGMLLTGCPTETTPTTYLDFENVTFNSASYVYDGKAHILNEVSGVPEGTKVTYTGRESKINVGEYPATALLSKSGYNDKKLSATLSITPATFTNIKFNNKTVTYTGNEFSITCTNVPSFATVTYQNNKGTNAGTKVLPLSSTN